MEENPVVEQDMEQEEVTVTLTLDDGSQLECVVLTIFDAGEREYIALLPMDSEETDEGEVYLYRYTEDADGNPNLENIESDEEYDIVVFLPRFRCRHIPGAQGTGRGSRA